MVNDKLVYHWRYIAFLNCSYDGNREDDEVIYPDDSGRFASDLDENMVVDLLCRDERVPQWIDIAVAYSALDHTGLTLFCCGRYHADDVRLYYFDQGTHPFGIKRPILPFDYKEGQKFNLPCESDFFAGMGKKWKEKK